MTPILYIWLAVIIFALIAEAMTAMLTAIWFVPAGIVCMVLEALNLPVFLQIVVFAVMSVIGIAFFAVKLRSNIERNKVPTNFDALIGKRAITETDIFPDVGGRVKINGMSWAALSVDNKEIKENTAVKVLEINGVKLTIELLSE